MLRHFFRRNGSDGFRVRSAERDDLSDRKTLGLLGAAIDQALATLEVERDGLSQRLKDARDLASVAAGTEADEYLTRELATFTDLRRLEQQMIRATSRLKTLEAEVTNLRFVRAVFHTRFSAVLSK